MRGHTFADALSEKSATRNPQLGGGRGLGGITAEGRPQERRPLFDDVNVLVPIWLGGRGDRPAFAIGPGCPGQRGKLFDGKLPPTRWGR